MDSLFSHTYFKVTMKKSSSFFIVCLKVHMEKWLVNREQVKMVCLYVSAQGQAKLLLIVFLCDGNCSFHLSRVVAILDKRQKRAEELRRLTDKSASMSEEQLTELRADIKVRACTYTGTCTRIHTGTVIPLFPPLLFYFSIL